MMKFKDAAQAVVDGDVSRLQGLLLEQPELVSARSPEHGATLMHYVGANGPVEDDMQKTPPTAVEVAQLLLSSGAVVDATIEDEPASTPLVSLVTSVFPAEAGLQSELTTLFIGAGAAANGLKDDGYPLAGALLFGYPDAVSALLQCGARVDNIVVAAALGRMEYVKSSIDDEGNLTETGSGYADPFMREFEPADVVSTAIEHALEYGHKDIADFLSSSVKPE